MPRSRRPGHLGNEPGWAAGRRAWSMVRTVAAIESDSVVRRALRQRQASTGPAAREATAPLPALPQTPQARRFRAKLMAGPHDRAVEGARLLLELAEPDSFRGARRVAFPSGASSPEAELALAEAWEAFRHDRYRSLN